MSDGLGWLDGQVARLAGMRRQFGPEGGDSEPEVLPKVSVRNELLLHLIYRDSGGEESERTVLVREVFRKDNTIHLGGHCFLRNMTRQFRADRIVTLANGRTGEVIANVPEFLAAIAPAADKAHGNIGYREGSPAGRAAEKGARLSSGDVTGWRDAARPLAILMMVLAKADGEWHPEEAKVLDAMISERGRRLGLPDAAARRALMIAEFSALVPSGNLVTRSCKALLRDRDGFTDAPRWCRAMIEADGQLKPEELHEFRAIVARLGELSG